MTRGGHLRRNETSVHDFRTSAPTRTPKDQPSTSPPRRMSSARASHFQAQTFESQFAYEQASPHRSNGGDT